MADEAAAAPAQKETPLDALRRGIFVLMFVALPVGGALVSAARLSHILDAMQATDLPFSTLMYVWGSWAVGTAIIFLGGSGKDAAPLIRSVVVGVGVIVLLLTGSL